MISVSQAEKIIHQNIKHSSITTQSLELCCGLVLKENVYADRDLPAFNKSLMDGIAICLNDWQKGQRTFRVIGIAPAGKHPLKAIQKSCVEIMTGAVVPSGYDCVIPIEQVVIDQKLATIDSRIKLNKLQNIHLKARDHKKGELLLSKGVVLTPPRIGILASVGKVSVKVSKKLSIAIISTGDELIAIDQKPKTYQTRLSNSYALKAAFNLGNLFTSQIFHLKDNQKQMLLKLRKLLNQFDCLILSGGVSMGKFDYVPQVLKKLSVKVLFHKVAQKPGKPLWFGVYKNKTVFALPGNPVSTLTCAYRYVLPALKSALEIKEVQKYAHFLQPLSVHNNLTNFKPIQYNGPSLDSKVLPIHNSGDFAALAKSDGFIEIPPTKEFKKNIHRYKLFTWE